MYARINDNSNDAVRVRLLLPSTLSCKRRLHMLQQLVHTYIAKVISMEHNARIEHMSYIRKTDAQAPQAYTLATLGQRILLLRCDNYMRDTYSSTKVCNYVVMARYIVSYRISRY